MIDAWRPILAAEGTPLTTVATHPDMGIGAGARMVANCAGIRGVAGLNATVWIEDRTAEVGVDDLDGAGEVWMDAQICAICTCRGRIATKLAVSKFEVTPRYESNTPPIVVPSEKSFRVARWTELSKMRRQSIVKEFGP